MLSRRESLRATAGTALPASSWVRTLRRAPPSIDAARLRARLERLSQFGRPDGGTFQSGVSRVAYSDADLAGRTGVPSIGGISHSPMERTSWEDCANGANVLLGAILDIDAKDTIA